MHKKLSELEDMWEERNTDEGKLSRVSVASKQRSRIVVSIFFTCPTFYMIKSVQQNLH